MHTFASSINVISHLSYLDWFVLCITSLLTIALIIYGHKKQTSVKEYLVMSRQLSLPLFVATLVATWYGGIFGVTQIAFEQGIYNLFTQGVFWYITYLIFAFYLVKKIRSYQAVTLPDLVNKIYGKKSAALTAIFVFVKTLPIVYAISIGIFLQLFLPVSLFTATCLGVLLVVIYAISGGLRAVVYSNTAQFVLMCFGTSSVLLFSIFNFGGMDFLHANLPTSYFHPCGTNSFATTLVWFFIACSITFISPAFYQRCFAAKSNKVATIGILISTMIWFLFDLCTTFGAMYAKAVIPQADSVHAYITYGLQLLPNGFRGLLIASIMATILSSLDSFLFIASNILSYDLKIIRLRSMKMRHIVAIIATAAFTILLSVFFSGKIEKLWLVYKGYFSACLLIPIMFGYFWPKLANDKVFCASGIISCINMTVWNVAFAQKYTQVDAFYVGCGSAMVVFGVYAVYKAYYVMPNKAKINSA